MGLFKRKNDDVRRIASMSSQQKANMIKRLERERKKINSEIEGILKSYAKESGNNALRKKKTGRAGLDGLFDSDV